MPRDCLTVCDRFLKKHLGGSRAACRAGSDSYNIGGLKTDFNGVSAPFTLSALEIEMPRLFNV